MTNPFLKTPSLAEGMSNPFLEKPKMGDWANELRKEVPEDVLSEYSISDWADIVFEHRERTTGGELKATDRETGDEVGALGFFFLDENTIMFREVYVAEAYRRRYVCAALLRYLHLSYPHAKINPGTRNALGNTFFAAVQDRVPELFQEHAVHNVPLNLQVPPVLGLRESPSIPVGG